MAKYKLLLHRVEVEVAGARRTCKHDDSHAILKSEVSLVVREGQYDRRVYCRECGIRMVEHTRQALETLAQAINRLGNEDG